MADSTVYLYTSLTAGSSHIITATSRLETILKANKVPFRALDCATDEKARQLWGRRSKGRKLPGLVKHGQVIADLDTVEEWNEFGELVDNVNSVSDIFGDTPMTDTPTAPPPSNFPPDAMQKPYDKPAPTRPSVGGRHISISEPSSKERDSPAASLKSDETPLAMAMRQAGAEAAAKAGQRKASGPISSAKAAATSAASIPASPSALKRDITDTVPNPQTTKLSADAAVDKPSTPPVAITSAKTPAQLAADGALRQTSLSAKSADLTSSDTPSPESQSKSDAGLSKEEQVLDMRRKSSLVKTTSHLAEETHVDDIAPGKSEPEPAGHRGSSVTEVPKGVAAKVEEQNKIVEEGEHTESKNAASGISATDKEEKAVTKGQDPQKGKAADADEAGVSVGD